MKFELHCDLFKLAHLSQFTSSMKTPPLMQGIQVVPHGNDVLMMATDREIGGIYCDHTAEHDGLPEDGINLFYPNEFDVIAKKAGRLSLSSDPDGAAYYEELRPRP